MLGYIWGVSQYPQLFVKYLDMYQMLPRPYLRSFDGCPGDKLIKNRVINLANRSEKFVWECIESRIMSDDLGKIYISQYWSTLKKNWRRQKNTTINMQNWGNYFYFYGCNWW